jgi:hypothetical protein
VRILPPGASDPLALIHVRNAPAADELRCLEGHTYGDHILAAPCRGGHRDVIELVSAVNGFATAPAAFEPLPPQIAPVYGIESLDHDDLTAQIR